MSVMKNETADRAKLLPTLAHYNKIRGRDEWKHHDTVIVVGREEPRPIDVDRVARAIWADDPRPLNFVKSGRFVEVSRGYRLSDGSRKGVMTSIHPDPRPQRVLELIRRCEFLNPQRPVGAKRHRRQGGQVGGEVHAIDHLFTHLRRYSLDPVHFT